MVKMNKPHIMEDLQSVTHAEFARHSRSPAKPLKASEGARKVMVKGRGGLVILGEAEYKRMLRSLEEDEHHAEIRRGIAQSKVGQGSPARAFLDSLKRKYTKKG